MPLSITTDLTSHLNAVDIYFTSKFLDGVSDAVLCQAEKFIGPCDDL